GVAGGRPGQVGLYRGDGLVGVAGLPAQVDQAGPDLLAPWRRPAALGDHHAVRCSWAPRARGAQAAGKFEDDPLGTLTADPGGPGCAPRYPRGAPRGATRPG